MRAAPGTHVFVVPEAENDAVLFWGRRMLLEVGADGVLSWSMPRGTYRVGTREAGVLRTVVVPPDGTTVDLGD